MASFQAFTMLIPAAAIGARCSSRTLFSIILSTFWLKEHILKTEYISMLLCIIGVATFVTDSLLSEPLVNQEAFTYLSDTWITIIGFSLCVFGGISRSLGMVSYRSIKSDVDPITVVLLHATLSCVVSVPLMVLTQKPVWPDSTDSWLYLTGACVTASIATFSSNAA